jgi:zinc transporter, ZIP family
MITLILAASATALATGIGAVPVFLLGERAAELRPGLIGLAAGVMSVASVAGLLLPGLDDGTPLEVGAGLLAGAVFLGVVRSYLNHSRFRAEERRIRGTALLVFIVLLAHSLPEGFAIGTAYASDTAGLSLFVIVAIALQNIPEGTSVAIPMAAAGDSRARQFWAAVASSAPQPVGAVIAYLLVEEVTALLPVSFGFAAGAMLTLVLVELAPQMLRTDARLGLAGALVGGLVMLALSRALGV